VITDDLLLDSSFIYSFHFVKDTILYTGELTRDINDSVLVESNLDMNSKYYWHVRVSNIYGSSTYTGWRSFTVLPTGIDKLSDKIPDSYKLEYNYPNPFNPITKIKFDIPAFAPLPSGPQDPVEKGQGVRLDIYNSLGQLVTTLVNQSAGSGLSPGTYDVEFNGTNYPSGVYYYQLIAGDYIETKKMVLIK
jgi:hypothetical protein